METGKKKSSPSLMINRFVVWRRYGDRGIIVHTKRAEMLVLNETGIRIIELIENGKNLNEIVNILKAEYEGNKREIERTTKDFINNMRKRGIIDG